MPEHGTPSRFEDNDIGFYIQFQSAVLRQLPRPHQISRGLLLSWLRNQKKLKEVLLQALVARPTLPDIDLDKPIEEIFTEELCCEKLGFARTIRTRFFHVCSEENIETLADVAMMTVNKWLRVPGVGRTFLELVEAVLATYGLELGMKFPMVHPELSDR
jgi:hypothetical protein